MNVFSYGAGDMLLQYIKEVFPGSVRSGDTVPVGGPLPELVVVGSDLPGASPDNSPEERLECLKSFLHALSHLSGSSLPKSLCFISSDHVYSPDAGEDLDEEIPLNPADDEGRLALAGENECRLWAEAAGLPLLILRPAMMLGNDVGGTALALFEDVMAGRYIHVRGQEGRISMVTALDVARVIKELCGVNGTFNVSDGNSATWLQIAEAMSANTGKEKRMPALPEKWADLAWRMASAIPAVKASLSPAVRERRSLSRTLSIARLRAALPDFAPFPALDVLARRAPKYPYTL